MAGFKLFWGILGITTLTYAQNIKTQECGMKQSEATDCSSESELDKLDENGDYFLERNRGHSSMSEGMNSIYDDNEINVITKTLLLNQDDPVKAKAALLQYFYDTFDVFSSLYENVNEDYFWARADPLRHPVGWYIGHCSCFYVNKLRVAGVINEPLNKPFESKFAIGVDEMSWDDKLEDRDDWPPVKEVKEYRKQVRDLVSQLIKDLPMTLPIRWESDWWTVLMGIEHERIHVETSSVLIRQLPINALNKPFSIWENECTIGEFDFGNSPKNELIDVNGIDFIEYGRKIDTFNKGIDNPLPVYGWDNEFGESIVTEVPSFKASKYLVSNEEYYEFVLDNGYKNKEYWTKEGWRWVTTTKSKYPKFWISTNNKNKFKYRNMLTIIDLPWDWPVITNQLEAYAFTQWKSKKLNKNIRLPTEDEWFVLRKKLKNCNDTCELEQPLWDIAPGNINLEFFTSETPVDMFPYGDTGFYDIVGNVWQHTLTPQHPFKGFVVHPYYDDFTVPCFGSEHNLIKGGSWVSTGNEAISYSRYQFRRHFFQFAGIRYVESDRDLSFLTLVGDDSPYTDNTMIDLYTHFHYWDEKYFGVQNFAKSVADVSIKHMNPSMKGRALDLGCATGRTTYELAKVFDHVTGLDFTARLIGVGYRLQEQGFLEWEMSYQGDIKQHYKVTLDELGFTNLTNKVFFGQNDAQNLDPQYTNYDLVVASNLIDRLSNPLLFLQRIHERINKNGKLIILSPYTWLEEYTPKKLWIGGKYDENNPTKSIETQDALKNILGEWFEYETSENVEMVIRETGRKFQHTLSHCTVWKKK